MVEFLYEYQGTQYIHWAAVAAVVVVLVYYIKQYYCAEGLGGAQSVYTGPAGVYTHELDGNISGYTSAGRRPMDTVGIVNNSTVGDFTGEDQMSSFLSGREAPVILPYPALGPHQYMKAVHDAVQQGEAAQVSGFHDRYPSQANQALGPALATSLIGA